MKGLLGLFSAIGLIATTALANEDKGAWVDATRDGNMVRLEVFAALQAGEGGRYELTATKQGTSGRSMNRQAGNVPVSDGSARGPISTSSFSVERGATLEVELRVVSASGEVYEDVVSIVGE